MTKQDFIEIKKQNKYINDLLKMNQDENSHKLENFFHGLKEGMDAYDFYVCIHTHADNVFVNVYDGTKEDSQSLTIQNFKVIKKSDNFNPLVFDLVEIWLRDLK